MAYDGLMMAAIVGELNAWKGARIEKIYQPEKTTLNILWSQPQLGRKHLLLSASPQSPKVYLTENKQQNPPAPPMFCMLLRKYLQGTRLLKVEQLGLERVLVFYFSGKDELGNNIDYRLIAEIMGRHSNIILVGPEQQIIDAIKRVPPALSSVRIVLPGLTYSIPPQEGRVDSLSLGNAAALEKAVTGTAMGIEGALVRRLTGISPLVAKELLTRTGIAKGTPPEELTRDSWQALWLEMAKLQKAVEENNYKLSHAAGAYAALMLTHIEAKPWTGSANALVAEVAERAQEESLLQKAKQNLNSILQKQIKREKRKLRYQELELEGMQEDLPLRQRGELILANLTAIKAKANSALLINYFDPQLETVEIELDPRYDGVQNARRYFKRYERARKGIPIVERNIRNTNRSLQHLGSLQNFLEEAENLALVEEIEMEMQEHGLIKKERRPKPRPTRPSAPLTISSPAGREIFVGQNNLQNERLYRSAQGDDWWLHAQGIPGSHVLIKGSQEADKETLKIAAELAAYYSKGKNESRVPVDFTRRKYVRKPSGSPPGFVTYQNQETILVEPKKHV